MNFGESGGFVRGLDAWIERDEPLGAEGGYSKARVCILKCSDCQWKGEFSPAMQHFRETGHAMTYRGIPQDLANQVRR